MHVARLRCCVACRLTRHVLHTACRSRCSQLVELLLGLAGAMHTSSQHAAARRGAASDEVAQAHQVLLDALCAQVQQRLYGFKPVQLATLLGGCGRVLAVRAQAAAQRSATAAGAPPNPARLLPETSGGARGRAEHMAVLVRLRLQQLLPLCKTDQVRCKSRGCWTGAWDRQGVRSSR